MSIHYKIINKLFNYTSVFICGAFLLSACSGNKFSVQTERKNVAFDSYKTYRWYGKSGFDKKGRVSEITYDYIRRAIDKELSAKQLLKKSEGAVDFYVNFTVTAKTRVETKNYKVYSGVGEGFTYNRDTGFRSSFSSEQVSEDVYYREGTLLIDIIDPFSDKLTWRGKVNKRLPKDKELSQNKREKLISQAISAVLSNFPLPEK